MNEPVSFEEGNRRLLELASLLEDIPTVHPEGHELRGYDQMHLVHPCGSPACAWGHWMLSSTDRLERALANAGDFHGGYRQFWVTKEGSTEKEMHRIATIEAARPEFHLDKMECEELFGGQGCGNARTGSQAAAYIRRFVAERSPTERSGLEALMGRPS